ncbi:N-acetylmuramoyl-L-alanine amidase [Micropruina sp.]|uniref:N-acetylmuramoyl-L-alanine amidase n=1 Tax=Micropruina sp. TaxID=2737536 RepID=UPI0039E3945F
MGAALPHPSARALRRGPRPHLAGSVIAIACLLTGCTAPPSAPADPQPRTPVATSSTAGAPATPSGSTAASTPGSAPASSPGRTTATPKQPGKVLAGRTIVVDPGHNGRYEKSFNTRQVPAGNGRTKACNSSGTAGKGLSEHAYTWSQAQKLAAELEQRGARVLLTRTNDAGLGPCVNKRAQVANDAKADLLISIHADGNEARQARGFHIIVSTTMAGGSSLEQRSARLARLARTALAQRTTMPRSNYIGSGTALSLRSDIATLNLLTRTPGIMLEMGNMRHPADLALQKSRAFQHQVADALANAAQRALTR